MYSVRTQTLYPLRNRVGTSILEDADNLLTWFCLYGPNRILLNHSPSRLGDLSVNCLRSLGLTERDRLLLVTRPPLDDKDDTKKKLFKPLMPSGSEVEELIFRVLREKCLDHCSRSNIALKPSIAAPRHGVWRSVGHWVLSSH